MPILNNNIGIQQAMSSIIDGLLFAWQKNSDYGSGLVSDLSEAQMTLQPAPEGKSPANHPAWVLSHLNVYIPIIESLIQGKAFDDPKGHQFGMQSKPESDASIYAARQQLIEEYVAGHQRVTSLLKDAGAASLEQDVLLERWKPVMPKTGIALLYLMLNHENVHLGQVSAWRRIQGMPSV